MHFNNIIHYDIKPDNLLVDSHEKVKIGDFGISLDKTEKSKAKVRLMNGSPLFASPEYLSGTMFLILAKKAEKPADIWALGISLYCFVHGKFPFEDNSALYVFEKIQNEEPEYRNDLDPELKNLIQLMLIKKERNRPKVGDIKKNAWVTNDGQCPMIPTSINCWKQTLTQEEVDTAVTTVYFPIKVIDFNKVAGKFEEKNEKVSKVCQSSKCWQSVAQISFT